MVRKPVSVMFPGICVLSPASRCLGFPVTKKRTSGTLGAIENTTQATWREAFDTNVIGASIVTAAALPHLQATSGAALYLSSTSASQTLPWPGLGSYAVSKAALVHLTRS